MIRTSKTFFFLSIIMLVSFAGSGLAKEKFEIDLPEEAPKIKPTLLLATLVGEKNDQGFDEVDIKVDRGEGVYEIEAKGGRVKADVTINIATGEIVESRLSGETGRFEKRRVYKPRLPRVSVGFNQVDSILQQPYANLPKGKIYGWTFQQVKKGKGKYAPYMSDSRMKAAYEAPDGNYLLKGWSDGGNSCFQAMPNDINKHAPGGFSSYGSGSASWLILVNNKGELQKPVICLRGGRVRDPMFDPWGRIYLTGPNIRNGNHGSALKINGINDGGGLIIVDSDFKKCLFQSAMGTDIFAIKLDPVAGILVIAGEHRTGAVKVRSKKGKKTKDGIAFNEVNSLRDKPSKRPEKNGMDAFLVVLRLWPDMVQAKLEPEPVAEENPETTPKATSEETPEAVAEKTPPAPEPEVVQQPEPEEEPEPTPPPAPEKPAEPEPEGFLGI